MGVSGCSKFGMVLVLGPVLRERGGESESGVVDGFFDTPDSRRFFFLGFGCFLGDALLHT